MQPSTPTPPSAQPENPLLAPWSGPYGGVPPFDKVKVEDFKPALEAAMDGQPAEIDAIADDPAAPTFENTIAALERRGPRRSTASSTIYGVWTLDHERRRSSRPSSARWRPSSPRSRDEITQNEKLFQRIEAVYDAREKAKLTPEQQRLAWLDYTNFVRAGAKLDAAGQEAARARSTSAWPRSTRRSARTCSPTRRATSLDPRRARPISRACPSRVRAGAAAAAEAARPEGQVGRSPTRARRWSRSSPTRRAATCARRCGAMFVSRGDNGDAHDNNAIITEILQLRAERAKLLGYPDATRTGASRTPWPRRPSAPWS